MPKSKNPLQSVMIFVDGASSGNPGPGGWGGIIVTPEGVVSEIGGRVASTTNNRMELTAAIRGLCHLEDSLQTSATDISVYTDSTYVIRGITQWIWNWMRNGWKSGEGKDVANADLWKKLATVAKGKQIEWNYVRGHSGIPGNERADEIAVAFSKRIPLSLFEGPLLKYPVPIHDLPDGPGELPEMRPKKVAVKAFSYLSVVDGVPMRHSTWKDCEQRVKGRSGAKFKKAMSEEEECAILKAWGYSLAEVR